MPIFGVCKLHTYIIYSQEPLRPKHFPTDVGPLVLGFSAFMFSKYHLGRSFAPNVPHLWGFHPIPPKFRNFLAIIPIFFCNYFNAKKRSKRGPTKWGITSLLAIYNITVYKPFLSVGKLCE